MDLDLKLRGTGSSKFERVQIWDMPFEHRPGLLTKRTASFNVLSDALLSSIYGTRVTEC